MKRIAIISLLAVFLTTNYAYATITTKEVVKKIEQAQCGELTQEEVEELFMEGIGSLDWENLAQIKPNASPCQMLTALIFLNLIAYPSSPILALWNIVANTRLYLLLCGQPFSPQFGSIAPWEGEQGDQNISVVITGINTNFVTGETFVSFGQGIETVGTVDVDTQTELSVQINIDEMAIPEPRTVTVTYPTGFITGVNVFEVVENPF